MRRAILDTDQGLQSLDIDAWGDDVVVLEDGPRVWDQPWAVWHEDWELIGTQSQVDDQCVLTVVRIRDPESRLVTQLRWPTRDREDLLADHARGARLISEFMRQRRKTP